MDLGVIITHFFGASSTNERYTSDCLEAFNIRPAEDVSALGAGLGWCLQGGQAGHPESGLAGLQSVVRAARPALCLPQ